MARPKNLALREFLLRNMPEHPTDIVPYTVSTLGVSRASANLYLRDLIGEGLIEAHGRTKAREYRLKWLHGYVGTFAIGPSLQEDVVLRENIAPRLKGLAANIVGICEYGFAEILNNAIEHSEGTTCDVRLSHDYARVILHIQDNGVGIFDKIARDCHLVDKREALLELSKGKLTTDSRNHTGEGIFFTSRMFDRFAIASGGLRYSRVKQDDNEWLIESTDNGATLSGTIVWMEIGTDAQQTAKEIFDQYVDDDYRFSRTQVPLVLAKYEGENLVSRSQARRLLARVERFSQVMLDFQGINEIGQAFADEIFRVWAAEHPDVRIIPQNATQDVDRMIRHALANATDARPPR